MRMLEGIIARYPWFTTARLLHSSGSGTDDPALKLHTLAYPRPDFMLVHISPEELGINKGCPAEPEFEPEPRPEVRPEGRLEFEPEPLSDRMPEDPIDKFLSWGGHRVTPDGNATDEDAAAGSARLDITDDMITEELAGIYAAQGLNREAKEIYERLCLLNPEKSVYFASVIDKITLGDKP